MPKDSFNINFGTSWKGKGSDFDPKATTPRASILSASLQFVPAHGWTKEALSAGAKSIDYSTSAHGLFERGGIELVEYFVRRTTGEVREEMESMELEKMKVTQKVRMGVLLRLERLKPVVKRWPEVRIRLDSN
ncbi:hypothetical protein BC829DRAFT_397069 [Chytridium lagenaria]|nr:hypothetical protein BC829DRAFT_397069 [Chytridium lagenaria]